MVNWIWPDVNRRPWDRFLKRHLLAHDGQQQAQNRAIVVGQVNHIIPADHGRCTTIEEGFGQLGRGQSFSATDD